MIQINAEAGCSGMLQRQGVACRFIRTGEAVAAPKSLALN